MNTSDWIILIAMITIMLVVLGSTQSVFADYYRTMGVYHQYNPQVCIMNPDPSEDTRLEMISETTYSAISEWEDKLNASGGNWQFFISEYEFEEHDKLSVDSYPKCTVFINYRYGEENSSVGRTGFDFSSSDRYYYWVEIDLNTPEKRLQIHLGETMNESTISNADVWQEIPENDIRNIVLHEFGHALGVEHYYVNTNCIEEECDYSPIMFGSISVFEGQIKNVTSKDIDIVKRIYGEDGFGSLQPKYIPRECNLDVEWYSRGC